VREKYIWLNCIFERIEGAKAYRLSKQYCILKNAEAASDRLSFQSGWALISE